MFKNPKIRRILRVVLMGLVLLDIVLLSLLFFINVDNTLYQAILVFDLIVVILLITQFVYQFRAAENKTQFLKSNWFDLLGMVPEILIPGFATFLRYFRLIRILSLFRKNLNNFFAFIEKTNLEYGIITLIFVLVSAASVFYFFEYGVNPNVNSIDDAMWYVLITITTVGFGDIYPFTIGGRVATVIIIVAGIGFVSYLAASITSLFFEAAKEEEEIEEKEMEAFEESAKEQLMSLKEDLKEINEKLDKMNKDER